jgi:hypothetical protein
MGYTNAPGTVALCHRWLDEIHAADLGEALDRLHTWQP